MLFDLVGLISFTDNVAEVGVVVLVVSVLLTGFEFAQAETDRIIATKSRILIILFILSFLIYSISVAFIIGPKTCFLRLTTPSSITLDSEASVSNAVSIIVFVL